MHERKGYSCKRNVSRYDVQKMEKRERREREVRRKGGVIFFCFPPFLLE